MTSSYLPYLGRPVFLKKPPSDATALERDTLRIPCEVEGVPRPRISWSRVGKTLPVGKTKVKEGTLIISDLNVTTDGGLYECAAANSFGATKARIKVDVQRPQLPAGLYIV